MRNIYDSKGATHAGFGDLADQIKYNYFYNAIGQLIADSSQHIDKIRWNIQAKVDSVIFNNGNSSVSYTYDPLGNRLSKKVADTMTYYIRDAQGNSFATYRRVLRNEDTRLIEQYLYASSRLGVRSADIIVKIGNENALLPDSARCFSTAVGAVSFEQTNHLGDVVVTLSDKVLGSDNDYDDDNFAEYYKSIVKSANLTYPFGWDIPNRKYSNAPDYRFGFNGKENDKEWNVQDYGFRLYDTRIARFVSVDPITSEYPELTPYQFASNMPIAAIDLDGLEYYLVIWGARAGYQGHVSIAIPNVTKKKTAKGTTYERVANSFFSYEAAAQGSNDINRFIANPHRIVTGRISKSESMSLEEVKNPKLGSPDAIISIPSTPEEDFHAQTALSKISIEKK